MYAAMGLTILALIYLLASNYGESVKGAKRLLIALGAKCVSLAITLGITNETAKQL